MTDTVLAACIAIVFSGWVWRLKQELLHLQEGTVTGSESVVLHAVPTELHRNESRVVHHTHPTVAQRSAVESTHPSRRRADGVQVFVIGDA